MQKKPKAPGNLKSKSALQQDDSIKNSPDQTFLQHLKNVFRKMKENEEERKCCISGSVLLFFSLRNVRFPAVQAETRILQL